MKIIEMHVTPIAVTDPPLLNSVGIHAPYALRTIVELISDEGISGISEVPGDVEIVEALNASREVVIDADPFHQNTLGSLLSGKFSNTGVIERGDNPWDQRTATHVNSAIEVACLDMTGKAIERPVHDLLGGAVREQIPYAAYLFFKYEGAGGKWGFNLDPDAGGWAAVRQQQALDPEAIVTQAKSMVAEYGFRALKLKAGALHPETDVDAILALRRAFGPDVPLRIDPNAVWSVETAIKWGRKMRDVLEYYEDPVRGQEAMAMVGKELGIPMATNMCTTSFEEIPRSIKLGSEDVILSDHHYWGGLRPSLDLAAVCRTFDRGLSMHSNSHLGVSLMAMTHLAAAIPNLSYSLDTHYPWQSEEVIIDGAVKFEEGSIIVPKTPGLGVELDHAALKVLNKQYQACGLTKRDDVSEMKKIDPDWEMQLTRW